MRVLHVITTLDVGGAALHLLAQVRGQKQRGQRVRVAYLEGEGSLEQDFRAVGAEWVRSGWGSWGRDRWFCCVCGDTWPGVASSTVTC
ncbi:MAG: hypothetical protein V3T22_12340 [Planctomycetota bacterium]